MRDCDYVVSKLAWIILVLLCFSAASCNLVDIAPVKVMVSPASAYKIIKNSNVLSLRFSEPVDKNSVESITFLMFAGEKVHVKYMWKNASTLYVRPQTPLKTGLLYTLSSSGSAKTKAQKQFTIEVFQPFYYQRKGKPIQIISVTGAANTQRTTNEVTDVLASRTINFSEKIERSSFLNALSIVPKTEYTITWENDTSVNISPKTQWNAGTQYTLTIKNTLLAQNGSVLLEPYTFSFLTNKDFVAPQVENVSRASFSYVSNTLTSLNKSSLDGILYSEALLIRFSEAIDPKSIAQSFAITPSIKGTFGAYKNNQVVFLPEKPNGWDAEDVEYLLTISTSLKDTAGNTLLKEYRNTFTSGVPYMQITTLRVGDATTTLSDVTSNLNSVATMMRIIPNTLTNDSYVFEFTFSQEYEDSYKPTIEGKVSITSVGSLSASPQLASIAWSASNEILTLTYSNFKTPTDAMKKHIYKITISGGKSTKNHNGSYLKEDGYLYMYIVP